MESRTTADEGEMLGGRRIEQKGKRTHGSGHQGGDCWEAGRVRELNVMEKIQ